MAIPMEVDEVTDDRGHTWHSTFGPWRLDDTNRVEPAPTGGSLVRFAAKLSGPASGVLERIIGPLSARGQRRRIERLVHLAELIRRSD